MKRLETESSTQGGTMSDTTPSSILNGISNVMLGVSNLPKSLEFYRDKLGLVVRFESPGFAFLDGGSVALALSVPLFESQESKVGAVELVFAVDNIQAAYETLKEAGVEFASEPRQVTPTDWAANFTDPDGHHLSIFGASPQGV